jgi:hypothetical protein
VLLLAACSGEKRAGSGVPKETNSDPPPVLDLREGSFGGVALGDTVRKMRREFGPNEAAAEGEPWTALSVGDDEDYSPRALGPGSDLGYRYEHVVFMLSGSEIIAIIVNDPAPQARDSGVGAGDDLAKAQGRYRLRCGTANENTEYESFPACVGRTAPGVYVWFGADPIQNITLSRTRPDGI